MKIVSRNYADLNSYERKSQGKGLIKPTCRKKRRDAKSFLEELLYFYSADERFETLKIDLKVSIVRWILTMITKEIVRRVSHKKIRVFFYFFFYLDRSIFADLKRSFIFSKMLFNTRVSLNGSFTRLNLREPISTEISTSIFISRRTLVFRNARRNSCEWRG